MKTYNKKYRLIELYGLLAIDTAVLILSYMLAYDLRVKLPFGANVGSVDYNRPVLFVSIVLCLFHNLALDRHSNFFKRGFFEEAWQVLRYNIVLLAGVSTFLFVSHVGSGYPRLMLAYFIALNLVLDYAAHIGFKHLFVRYYTKGKGSDKVFLVTDSATVDTVLAHISEDKAWSYEVTGLAIIDENMTGETIAGVKVVACADDLVNVARQMPIDIVFFYCPGWHTRVERWIQSFLVMGVRCYNCVQRFSFETPYSGIGKFADFPVLTYSMTQTDYRMIFIKRLMDLAGGTVGLLLTAIVTPFVALAIKLEDPAGPVFFGQTRIGKNGRRFTIYKFRSMYKDAEERKKELMAKNQMQGLMFKMDDDPRITKVGKFIRKTSIDELPQFWNIFKGDMSLVGTRPPTVDEFEKYNDYYRRRLSITPGLTGMWQVSGRSDITDFDEVVKLDLQYIDDWSIKKDIKILFQTVYVVLFGKGSK